MGRVLVFAALWLASALAPARADGFPTKPVTVVIPLAAGGAIDTMVRTMMDSLRGSLGQPILVENVTGAGGVTGITRVVRAAPDGYTISVGTWGTHIVNAFVYSTPYDLGKDLEAVALLPSVPHWFIARKNLPPANLIQGSDRYVVDPTGIRRELNIDPSTLGFDDSVEVATASYRVDGKTAHLLLLMYPTQQIAKKYEDRFATTASEDTGFRKRVGALVALVRGSRDSSVAKTILDGVNYETQVTWDEPRPDLSLREVILTIFTFIGIGLLFTIVVGVSFGGLRIFVKARYPDKVFDRPEDMEIIQLKLGQGLMHKQLRE